MQTDDLIPASECCTSYNLEYSFIHWLNEHELLEVTIVEEQPYIPVQQLSELEKFIRLHYELDINLEGIQAISHMLKRLDTMQHEIAQLKNRLHIYE
jgi:hypothetical protein